MAGVASSAGRTVAAILALFRLLGVLGVVLTAMEHEGFTGTTNAQRGLSDPWAVEPWVPSVGSAARAVERDEVTP